MLPTAFFVGLDEPDQSWWRRITQRFVSPSARSSHAHARLLARAVSKWLSSSSTNPISKCESSQCVCPTDSWRKSSACRDRSCACRQGQNHNRPRHTNLNHPQSGKQSLWERWTNQQPHSAPARASTSFQPPCGRHTVCGQPLNECKQWCAHLK